MDTLINNLDIQELSNEELQQIDGGIAPLLAFGVYCIGSMIAGAAVGYGVTALVDWATK